MLAVFLGVATLSSVLLAALGWLLLQQDRDGERVEYRVEDFTAAAREYGRLTTSPDAAVRAGALGRLARVQRKLARVDDALASPHSIGSLGFRKW